MDEALIAAHGEEAKLMPFLHLPVQSGSDRVLKAMNRRHRAEDYLRLVERIRAARPDMAMSGDFIVGFPGETEADFADTLALVEAVGYAQAYSFAYSPRPGTPAAGRAQVAREVERRAAPAPPGAPRAPAGGVPGRPRRPRRFRCWSRSRAASPARWSAARPISTPSTSRAARHRRHDRHRPHRRDGDELPRGPSASRLRTSAKPPAVPCTSTGMKTRLTSHRYLAAIP